jgi:hypothetical protein
MPAISGPRTMSYPWAYDLFRVFVDHSQSFAQVGNVGSVDRALLYSENKLGCARGVIWAFVFEATLIIAIAIFWKLRFFLR